MRDRSGEDGEVCVCRVQRSAGRHRSPEVSRTPTQIARAYGGNRSSEPAEHPFERREETAFDPQLITET